MNEINAEFNAEINALWFVLLCSCPQCVGESFEASQIESASPKY